MVSVSRHGVFEALCLDIAESRPQFGEMLTARRCCAAREAPAGVRGHAARALYFDERRAAAEDALLAKADTNFRPGYVRMVHSGLEAALRTAKRISTLHLLYSFDDSDVGTVSVVV